MGRGNNNLLYHPSNVETRENWKLHEFEEWSSIYLKNHAINEWVEDGDIAYENILQHFYLNAPDTSSSSIGTNSWKVALTPKAINTYLKSEWMTKIKEMEPTLADASINEEPIMSKQEEFFQKVLFDEKYQADVLSGKIDDLIPIAFNTIKDDVSERKIVIAHEIDPPDFSEANNFNQWYLHSPDLETRPSFCFASSVLPIQQMITEEAYPYYFSKEQSILFISGIPEQGIHSGRENKNNGKIEAVVNCLSRPALIKKCPWFA